MQGVSLLFNPLTAVPGYDFTIQPVSPLPLSVDTLPVVPPVLFDPIVIFKID